MKFLCGEVRQGDVALVRVVEEEIPSNWRSIRNPDGSVTLAYGEATGHHHSFGRFDRVALFRPDELGIGGCLVVEEPATIVHQEHAPLTVPAGLYIQAVQIEDDVDAIRVVID